VRFLSELISRRKAGVRLLSIGPRWHFSYRAVVTTRVPATRS